MVENIKNELTEVVNGWLKEAGVAVPVVMLERAASSAFGEYSINVAMRYAKELGRSPVDLASDLAEFLNTKELSFLERSEAVKPGFVNIYFTLSAKVAQIGFIKKTGADFGLNQSLSGQKWVVEHTSPNPNKAMHLGHLRNNLVGMGIIRLLTASGAEVVSDTVYNNRGIAIAKVMYGYLAHMKQEVNIPTDVEYWVENKEQWFTPEEKGVKPDLFLTECYVLGERDCQASEEIDQLVRQYVVDWEAGDKAMWKLWEEVLGYAYVGIDRSLQRLGSHWDKIWYEHEHYEKGKEYVEKGLRSGIFTELPDGAILTNLEEGYKLPDTILLKKDGTSLYITQDIALTDLKKQSYKADKLVWVIGPDQSMAMKQLFAVCDQLGIGKVSDFTHVSYGYVGLKADDGGFLKMSSRDGTVVFMDDVIDTVKDTIRARFNADAKHDEVKREELSEKLALAAVKFAFLRSDRTQDMTFDVEQSVDVQGDSGMYVMYTFVRTQSILRKAEDGARGAVPTTPVTLGEEATLLRSLLYFEAVIEKSTTDLSVHHVAQYLLELCSEFNSWYAKETVLDGSDRESYKVALTEAVSITIKNGLAILGINTVDEM